MSTDGAIDYELGEGDRATATLAEATTTGADGNRGLRMLTDAKWGEVEEEARLQSRFESLVGSSRGSTGFNGQFSKPMAG